jgi:Protein of unknown function (DUF3253)
VSPRAAPARDPRGDAGRLGAGRVGAGRADAQRAILDLLAQRDPGTTICPSEAARALGGGDGFRPLMPLVRDAAAALAAEGRIEVTQHGRRVDIEDARGPIRLRAR